MDQYIEDLVKSGRACALAANTTPIKFQPWLKTDVPWSRIHKDFAGPLNASNYIVVADSYTKWPEILKCRRLISTAAVHL